MTGSREVHVAARRRLIMLWHGQTSYSAIGRVQGQLDTQLSDAGREQARTVAQHLTKAEPRITKAVSSDLIRAAGTTHVLTEVTDAELSFDKHLRKTNPGEWQERAYDEIDSVFPGMRDHWRYNLSWASKGGETRLEVSNQMLVVIIELVANLDWESDTLVLAPRDDAIATAATALLQTPCDYFSTFDGLGNAAWVEMKQRTRVNDETSWCLNAFNVKIREREPQVFDSSGSHRAR